MVRIVVAVILAAAAAPSTATAQPACDPAELAAIEADARRARKVDTFWGVTFAVAAVGSGGFAALAPDDWIGSDTRAGLYVTSAKASLGAVSRFVMPLRLSVDPACARPSRAQLAKAARKERNGLILNLAGGFVVNTAGLLYLGLDRDAWRVGWIGFGVGSAVGIAAALTVPRRAWRMSKRVSVVPVAAPGFAGVAGAW